MEGYKARRDRVDEFFDFVYSEELRWCPTYEKPLIIFAKLLNFPDGDLEEPLGEDEYVSALEDIFDSLERFMNNKTGAKIFWTSLLYYSGFVRRGGEGFRNFERKCEAIERKTCEPV